MANSDAASRRQGKGSSTIAAVVAFAAIGLFLAWLATRKPADTVAVVEPGDTVAANTSTGGVDVTLDELNDNARVRDLRGQVVRVTNAEVAQALGTQLFWVQLPGGPFLVQLDSALVAGGTAAPSSGRVSFEGMLLEKTPAVLDRWEQSGVLQSADQRMLADFGSSYIEARRVTPGQ